MIVSVLLQKHVKLAHLLTGRWSNDCLCSHSLQWLTLKPESVFVFNFLSMNTNYWVLLTVKKKLFVSKWLKYKMQMSRWSFSLCFVCSCPPRRTGPLLLLRWKTDVVIHGGSVMTERHLNASRPASDDLRGGDGRACQSPELHQFSTSSSSASFSASGSSSMRSSSSSSSSSLLLSFSESAFFSLSLRFCSETSFFPFWPFLYTVEEHKQPSLTANQRLEVHFTFYLSALLFCLNTDEYWKRLLCCWNCRKTWQKNELCEHVTYRFL